MVVKHGLSQRILRIKIKSAQRAMERKMLNFKLLDEVRHTRIREKTKVTDVIDHMSRMKWRWAGHVARMTDWRWTNDALNRNQTEKREWEDQEPDGETKSPKPLEKNGHIRLKTGINGGT
jgi:hypothetical protein